MIPRRSAILLVLVTLASVAACSRHRLPAGSDRRAFDPAAWIAEGSSDARGGAPSVRQEMLRDLVTRVLPGKARGEIENVLGASLVTPYFADTKRDLIYPLGPERDSYIKIDSEWLLIWLDAQGRFRDYRVTTD